VVAGVLTSGDPFGGTQDASEVAQVVDDGGNVAVTSQLACGAGLPHLKIGEQIRLTFYGVGERKEESRAFGGERCAPSAGIKCPSSRSDGGVNVGGRSVWNLTDRRARGGMAQGEGASAGCPTLGAVNEHRWGERWSRLWRMGCHARRVGDTPRRWKWWAR
jgi:hypothetical protein